MKTEQAVHREVDPGLYEINRSKFPPEQLMQYAGDYVAFNWDGTELLASAPTDPELVAKLDAMGIPQECVVIGYIDGD